MDFGDPRRRVAAPVRCHPLQSAEVSQPPDLAEQGRHPRRNIDLIAWMAVVATGFVILERQNSPRTFYFDDWAIVLYRRSNGVHTWLDPHNGHLLLIPVAAYRLLMALFGLNHYRPYRFVGLGTHVFVATVIYRYVRARQSAATGLCAGAVMLFLGSGWEDIFQPFNMGNMAAVGFGVLVWLALDRRKQRTDVVASLVIGASLACGGVALSFLLGTIARLAIAREWRRLALVVVPPTALYAVWYLAFGQRQGSLDNLHLLPRYVADEAASSVGGLFGRDLLWGRIGIGILIGLAIAAALRLIARLQTIGITAGSAIPMIAAPTVSLVANWTLTGYSRADLGEPGSSRYVYVGAALIILVLAEILRVHNTCAAASTVVAVSLLSVWGNWYALHQGPIGMRDQSSVSRVELRAVEWASATVSPDFRADDQRLPGVRAGLYLPAVAEFHSPAATDGEVEATASSFGAEVDRVSLEAGRFAAVPADRVSACAFTGAAGSIAVRAGDSIVVTAGVDPVEVRLVRYAPTAPVEPQASIAPGQTATLTLPMDTAPRQEWRVGLRSSAAFDVCGPSTG
jgi:hypothetical protein